MTLSFFVNLGHISICQESMYNSYSWIYTENGNLIADQNIKMDPSILRCQSKSRDYSDYLYNRILILNKINPVNDMIKSGEQPSFILKVYLKKHKFSTYIIDSIILVDTLNNYLSVIFEAVQTQLLGTELYGICGGDYFYIHIPIKFNSKLVDPEHEVGITKSIQNGRFVISTVTNYVSDN